MPFERDYYFWLSYPFFALAVYCCIDFIAILWPALLFDKITVFFIFFLVLIPITYLLSTNGIKRGGPESVLIILGAQIIKMIVALILVAVYVLNFRLNAVVFGLDFFVLYVLFTGFEIHCLLHNLRLPKKANNSINK